MLFSVVLGLLTYGLLEFLSWMGLMWKFGRMEGVQKKLQAQSQTTAIRGIGRDFNKEDREAIPYEVVHPYLGFVRRPGPVPAGTSTPEPQYGLPTPHPIRHRAPGQVLVAIVGGSVAENFAAEAGEEFRQSLEKLPEFSGKKVVLVPLGFASYKQPQQVMLINYLMTLGGEFDYLINLDGYNELVLTATFNVPHHVFPSFPREWNLRVTRAADLETLRIVGRIAYLRDATQRWAALFDRWPLRHSPLALLVWQNVQNAFQETAHNQYAAFRTRQLDRLDYAGTGPLQQFSSDQELHDHCTQIWSRSSLQLHQISKAWGIKYYHFLQPNQYFPGSKPMGKQEREMAFDNAHESKPHVIAGYPLLQAAGKNLRDQNVKFHDLTQIFSQTETPIYRDTCCHVNGEGNHMLAEAILRAIANDP